MIERGARKGRPAPRIDLTGAEWKLSVATWLAVVYIASWFAIRTGNEGDPGATTPPAEAPPAAASDPRGPAAAARPTPAPRRAAPPRPRARPRTDVVSGASGR